MVTQFYRNHITVQSPSIADPTRGFTDAGDRRFVDAVFRVLNNVDRPGIGRIVVSRVRRNVTISPERRQLSRHGCAVERRESAARVRPGLVAGRHALTLEVQFTPLYYCLGGMWDARVILLHELFHVRAGRRGVQVNSTSYPSGEEFLATTVSNVYRSQLNLELRKGYLAFADPAYASLCTPANAAPPTPSRGMSMRGPSVGRSQALSTTPCAQAPSRGDLQRFSVDFAATYRDPLESFRRQEEATFTALANSSAPFNPFRALSTPARAPAP